MLPMAVPAAMVSTLRVQPPFSRFTCHRMKWKADLAAWLMQGSASAPWLAVSRQASNSPFCHCFGSSEMTIADEGAVSITPSPMASTTGPMTPDAEPSVLRETAQAVLTGRAEAWAHASRGVSVDLAVAFKRAL